MVDLPAVQRALSAAVRAGGEFAEVFVEDRKSSSARYDDGKVEELTSGRDRGAGIRVVRGDTTGFAHTADLSEAGLLAAAEAAGAAARSGGGGVREVNLTRQTSPRYSTVEVAPDTIGKAQKVELLERAAAAARAEGSALSSATVGYADSHRRILVANTDGLLAEDDQVRSHMGVQCVAMGDGGMQTGFERLSRTVGFELFAGEAVEELARVAARRALVKLQARPAPSGVLPVVIAKGSGGMLFHEACGHGLEADLVAKDSSVYRGKVGDLVASPLVTVVDDGTFTDEWGTSAIDDEGRPTGRNVLIQDGVLTDYMWDFLRARKEGRVSSGNGRRESYQVLPMVRMTNTYLLAGKDDPEDIISSTPTGIYLSRLGGGSVNTATGDFVFGMTEAYLIEDGQITAPIRDANLIGNGPEVLAAIDAIGNDFEMCPGTCGKDGQSVPVGTGQPTLRITGVTVGGTAGA